MEPPWRIHWAPVYIFLLECILNPVSATKVYLDRYGDCSRGDYFPVDANDEFSILSHGGEAFDTLRCEITFKSEADDRLCLHFRNFFISRCDVKLEVYPEQSASGKVLGTYSCHTEDIPSSLCSEERYLTVLFHKKTLGHHGYDFSMELREMTQSDAFRTGFDAFFLSIGVIIAIVVGVIVVVVISAVAIICCCCTKRHKGLVYRQTPKSASNGPGQDGGPVEPSAPPYPADEAPPTYSEPPPPYSSSQEVPSPTAPAAEKVRFEQSFLSFLTGPGKQWRPRSDSEEEIRCDSNYYNGLYETSYLHIQTARFPQLGSDMHMYDKSYETGSSS